MGWFDSATASGLPAKRKLRVVILNDSARIGGAERFLSYLAKKLDSKRFEVFAVCPKKGPLVDALENQNINVIPMDLSYFSLKGAPAMSGI